MPGVDSKMILKLLNRLSNQKISEVLLMLWAPSHSLPTCISIHGFVHAGILNRAIKHWHFENISTDPK